MSTVQSPAKKSWWPRVIITMFVLFILYIGLMVRKAMQTDVDLVSKDYYKEEIAYQQHIDKLEKTQQLGQSLTIVHAAAAEQVSLVFPAAFKGKQVTGSIRFFRPSDAKLDVVLPVKLNEEGQQHVSTAQMAKGFWQIEVSWEAEGKQYFMQQDLALN